jgi:hypothetical protein
MKLYCVFWCHNWSESTYGSTRIEARTEAEARQKFDDLLQDSAIIITQVTEFNNPPSFQTLAE